MISRRVSGKRWHFDMTSLAGWTADTAGAGTAVQSGSVVTFTTGADADRAYIVKNENILSPCVVRTRSKWTMPGSNDKLMACQLWHPAASKPSGNVSAFKYPLVMFRRSFAGARLWQNQWFATATNAVGALDDTWYCQEVNFAADDSCYFSHWADAFASQLLTQTRVGYAAQYGVNLKWLVIGDYNESADTRGVLVLDYAQCMENLSVTMTGLPSGSACRLYDSTGATIASAVTASGVATFDLKDVAGFDTNSNPDTSEGGFRGYFRVFRDNAYTQLIESVPFNDIWGGDIYEWEEPEPAPIPLLVIDRRRVARKPVVKIFDRLGANLLAVTTDYKDLSWETDVASGFHIADFEIGRDSLATLPEIDVFNQVLITDGAETCWEGYIDEPRREGKGVVKVGCTGWAALLNQLGCRTNQAPMKTSAFITNVLLADAEVAAFLTEGTLTTGAADYDCPAMEDLAPGGKFYAEILDDYNRYNDKRWLVYAKKRLHWLVKHTSLRDPSSTAPLWIVRASECDGFSVTDSPRNYWNRVYYTYSPTGSHKVPGMVEDTVSQGKYGRVVAIFFDIPGRCTPTEALEAANKKLLAGQDMVVVGQFTTRKVYSAETLVEVDPWLPKAGEPMLAVDLKPGEGTIDARQVVNSIATFEIKSTAYTAKGRRIKITPMQDDYGLSECLARFERRGSVL